MQNILQLYKIVQTLRVKILGAYFYLLVLLLNYRYAQAIYRLQDTREKNKLDEGVMWMKLTSGQDDW